LSARLLGGRVRQPSCQVNHAGLDIKQSHESIDYMSASGIRSGNTKRTMSELCRVINDRIGSNLDQSNVVKLAYHTANNSIPLLYTIRGHFLQIHSVEPKKTPTNFMDLPPELRVIFYRELLVDRCTSDDRAFRLYPAVLRTSKKVYRETKPTLCTENNVRATIDSVWLTLRVSRPGRTSPFRQGWQALKAYSEAPRGTYCRI
jgi:hypothetical protein